MGIGLLVLLIAFLVGLVWWYFYYTLEEFEVVSRAISITYERQGYGEVTSYVPLSEYRASGQSGGEVRVVEVGSRVVPTVTCSELILGILDCDEVGYGTEKVFETRVYFTHRVSRWNTVHDVFYSDPELPEGVRILSSSCRLFLKDASGKIVERGFVHMNVCLGLEPGRIYTFRLNVFTIPISVESVE